MNIDINNLCKIREIFYQLANDSELTLDEARELAKTGYYAAYELNGDLESIHKAIGQLLTW